ncbi:MAG: GyrI-like domain-containing protein [Kouleothrix sp.]|nr:GyrI-like domain-containing protein [Kouleothrix sp.]
MNRVDLRKELKQLYSPSTKEPSIVEIPELQFVMVDGAGNPNTAPEFAEAVEALYSVSYAIKFMLKKGPAALDVAVMPLEGLWWSSDMALFSALDKDSWKWTVMIAQPDVVSQALFEEALAQTRKKKLLVTLARLRLERYCEGPAAQIMYLGPYADEGPTIARLHQFIEEQGYARQGKHHEIYLGDPRRAAPEKMRTVIRQPIAARESQL